MKKNINAWLRLIRIPNVMTIPGDILVGIYLSGLSTNLQQTIMLIVISIFLYFAGLILNDICDYKEDVKLGRTKRPLVSKEISFKQAMSAFFIFVTLALTVAIFCSLSTFFISCLLLTLIVLYNVWARKYKFLGFTIMGLCRTVNILLGASLAINSVEKQLHFYFWGFALLEAFFIFLICVLAYDEEKKIPSQIWCKSLLIIPIILFCFICFAIYLNYQTTLYTHSFGFSAPPQLKQIISSFLLPIAILFFFSKRIITASLYLKPTLNPSQIPAIIGKLISSLILFQSFIVSLFCPITYLPLILIGCFLINSLWSKKFYAS